MVKSNYSVLVVDDSEFVAENIVMMLKLDGYSTICALNAIESLKILESERVDLILSDIRMPQMDGFEFLRVIREHPKFKLIPFVLLSGKGDSSDQLKSLMMGADFLLTKPITTSQLFECVEICLSKFGLKDDSLPEQCRVANNRNEYLRTKLAELKRKYDRLTTVGEGEIHEVDVEEFELMTGSIVHSMKNHVCVIHFLGRQIEKECPSNNVNFDEIRRIAGDVVRRSGVLDQDIQRLRKMTLDSGYRFEKLNVEMVLKETLEIHQNHRISQSLEVTEKVPEIIACKELLNILFANLVENSIQAMPNGGALIIKIDKVVGHVRVQFIDTGCGISSANIKKVFDKEFTTRKRGYGIGLYAAKSIIDRHSGFIEVDSVLRKGTKVTVQLPIGS